MHWSAVRISNLSFLASAAFMPDDVIFMENLCFISVGDNLGIRIPWAARWDVTGQNLLRIGPQFVFRPTAPLAKVSQAQLETLPETFIVVKKIISSAVLGFRRSEVFKSRREKEVSVVIDRIMMCVLRIANWARSGRALCGYAYSDRCQHYIDITLLY